jgi:hypothetical protein
MSNRVRQFFPCAFFASQKTGLSASIFWLCQKDLRCNPWRGQRLPVILHGKNWCTLSNPFHIKCVLFPIHSPQAKPARSKKNQGAYLPEYRQIPGFAGVPPCGLQAVKTRPEKL